MAKFVIKEDGSKEEFDASKIKRSIDLAAQEVGIEEGRRKEIIGQVSSTVLQMAGEKQAIQTKQIRQKILQELDFVEPSVSEAWRQFDKENK